MEEKIRKFLSKQKLLTLATSKDDIPYCCVVFYSFDADKNALYFISNPSSRHSEEIFLNANVAGTITKPELKIIKLQGVQFTGTCSLLDGSEAESAGRHYQNAHPVAYWSKERLWKLDLDWVKMTDNTLGFAKKIVWEKVPLLSGK